MLEEVSNTERNYTKNKGVNVDYQCLTYLHLKTLLHIDKQNLITTELVHLVQSKQFIHDL